MQYRIVEYGYLEGGIRFIGFGNARIWVSGRGEFGFLGWGMQHRIGGVR